MELRHPPEGLIYGFTFLLLFISSCGSPHQPEEKPGDRETPIPLSDEVPPDGTLEAVTWNLEWYGDNTYGSRGGKGPGNEGRQTRNIIKVTDSLKADLYAFQEIYNQQALNDLLQNMSGYKGFVAQHINWIQKTAFVYNTNTIDSLAAGVITQGQSEDAWAGRLPLFFRFTYTFKENSREFYAIVIHAKAFDDKESYERRKTAAQELHTYLTANKPNANIIFLGDYNDDVDESIYLSNEGQPAESPYLPFVKDDTQFRVITQSLSEEGESSTVTYPEMVDHITVSDEVYPLYVDNSAAVFSIDENFIEDYGNTTSDHYPVLAEFDVMNLKFQLP